MLNQLNIHNLRNIESKELLFHPNFNLLYGDNGSGKSSILEAIYLLSTGHSFRTRENSALIRHGSDTLTLFARVHDGETLSVQKSLQQPTKIQHNTMPCKRRSDLAKILPCQVFHQDIFQIIDAGPASRRMIIDWGLFHVEQSYHSLWKEYRQVIKQRSALLRQKARQADFLPWNTMLVELAHELDRLRCDYFKQWSDAFQTLLAQLSNTRCNISYYKGWDKRNSGKSLNSILDDQFTSDLQRQYTQSGAHQADILFETPPSTAKHMLSRGQQKIILIALKLAQSQLLSKPCLYLFDDVSAELDKSHLEQLAGVLNQINGQFFITAINKEVVELMAKDTNRFTFDVRP